MTRVAYFGVENMFGWIVLELQIRPALLISFERFHSSHTYSQWMILESQLYNPEALRRYRRNQIARQRLLSRIYKIDEKLRIFINLIEIAKVLTVLSRTRALTIVASPWRHRNANELDRILKRLNSLKFSKISLNFRKLTLETRPHNP